MRTGRALLRCAERQYDSYPYPYLDARHDVQGIPWPYEEMQSEGSDFLSEC